MAWRKRLGRPIPAFARRALVEALAYFPLRERLPGGAELFKYLGDRTFWRFVEEISIYKVYEPSPECVPAPGDFVLDLGAHVGLYSIRAAQLVGASGQVVAVEPDPKNYHLLKRNTSRVPGGKVLPVQIALWDRPCELTMTRSSSNFGATSAVLERDAESLRVRATTLDQLVHSLDLKKVSVVKMDVEGAAPAIIRGGPRTLGRLRPRVVCAAYHAVDEAEVVTDLLTELGYEVVPYEVRLPFASGPERYLYALPA